MLKVNFHSFGLAFLFTFFTSLAASGQTVQINPDAAIGPTILRSGWDIKGFPGRIDTLSEARGHYLDVDANFIRVPFSPRAHNEDGTVDVAEYATELNAIRSVMAVNCYYIERSNCRAVGLLSH